MAPGYRVRLSLTSIPTWVYDYRRDVPYPPDGLCERPEDSTQDGSEAAKPTGQHGG